MLLNFTIGLRLKDENENQAKREIEVDEANEMDSGEDDESEADLDEADYDSQCEKLNIFLSRLHCLVIIVTIINSNPRRNPCS